MGKTAWIFPGQGAQAVGMGKDIFETNETGKERFRQADETLGFALSNLIFNGPDETLKRTVHTQPALLTTSIALMEAYLEQGAVKPDFVAGHSLGEYSALVAAGVLQFQDAVALVKTRGELMEAAVPNGEGTMAAVLGAKREQLTDLCADITEQSGHVVELANVNCPGQIVISGKVEAVEQVKERASEAGAKRVIPLDVSGPFHSSLMKPAADKLALRLADTTMQHASIPVVANVTAKPAHLPDELRSLLEKQVTSPVLWEDSVRWLLEQGVDRFVEIGPGTVLAGLVKKVDRKVNIVSIRDLEDIRKGGDR